MNPISFGSTYIVSNKNNSYENFSKFANYALDREFVEGVQVRLNDCMSPKYPYDYKAQYTMVAPNEMDNEIERYCSYMGIEYTKLSTEELMDVEAIQKRIKKPENGMIRAEINPEKLMELAKRQYSNIEHCEKDYNCYFNDTIDYTLKSGKNFPTTTFMIRPAGSIQDELLNYIDVWGAENLNDNQIFLDFNQQTDLPDHCMFFALRDLGIEKVPVDVDLDTYILCEELGLLD